MRGTACGLVIAILLLSSARLVAAPVDKPSEFTIDLSTVCKEPVGLRLRTKKRWWQLPPARVRKGFGLAFFVVDDAATNSSIARVYIEVEPLGDRLFDDALNQAAEAVADVMAPFDTELVGTVTKADARNVKIGKHVVHSRMLLYKVDITTAVPRSQDDATAVVFEYKKALVTVTIERFKGADRRFTAQSVLSSLSFVDLPVKAKPIRLKLLDAAAHIHRYVTMELPSGFVAKHADCPNDVAALFVQGDAKPELGRPAITIRRIEPPKARGMNEFKNVADWRLSNFRDYYSEIAELSQAKVAGLAAYATNYLEDTESGKWRIFDVVFQVRDQLWVITMDVDAKDPESLKLGQSEFDKLLRSVACWIGT